MTKEQLIQAFIELKRTRCGEEFGIHALLASNTVSNDYYLTSAPTFELAVEVVEKTGVHLGFISLSGWSWGQLQARQEPNDIAIVGKVLHRFDEILKPAGLGHVKSIPSLFALCWLHGLSGKPESS